MDGEHGQEAERGKQLEVSETQARVLGKKASEQVAEKQAGESRRKQVETVGSDRPVGSVHLLKGI